MTIAERIAEQKAKEIDFLTDFVKNTRFKKRFLERIEVVDKLRVEAFNDGIANIYYKNKLIICVVSSDSDETLRQIITTAESCLID